MKRRLKPIANVVALVLVSPVVVTHRVAAWLGGPTRAFAAASELMSLAPGVLGVFLRRAFCRAVLPRCGPDVSIGFGTLMSHPTAELGARVYVGPGGMLGAVTIEDDALIGSHVSILNGSRQHGTERLDVPVREQPGVYPRVTLGPDCWIGDRAIVMADVGAQAIVGAGSVVTKAVPPRAVVAGSPARVLRYRGETPDPPPGVPTRRSTAAPTVGGNA